MIDRVAGNNALPESIRQDIIERTDGVPLFVEEMTRAVLEAESEGEAQRTTAAVPSPALAVPASLHASLTARLDRLGSAKEVAQIGAVIGREFPHPLIAAVARKGEPELCSALDRLIDAGLLFRQGVPPHATYLFKHALVQDAAYGTLLREPRRALHAHIADVLESQFPDVAENQPELLARHCAEAGLIEKAITLWGEAGRRSMARSALVEAAEQLGRALQYIKTMPVTPARRREQINLQVALITPLIHVKGYAAEETKAAAEEARALIEAANAAGDPPDDPLLLFSVLYTVSAAHYVDFKGMPLREFAPQVLTVAERQGDSGLLTIAHRIMGHSLFFTGDLIEGHEHYNRGLLLYRPAEHHYLASRFGQDTGVALLAYRAIASWVLGYPGAAQKDADDAVKAARQIGQAASLMFSLAHAVLPTSLCGNVVAATAQNDECFALAEEKSAPHWRAFGMMNRGWLLSSAGHASTAIQLISSGIEAYRATGSTNWIPLRLSHLAIAHSALGHSDEAWHCIQEALATVERTMEKWCEAEVARTAGELVLTRPVENAAKAGRYFEHALAVARQQQAKSWELRAAMSLARLWRDQGKVQEAREMLAPVYGWFTEGFDTLDLKQAKALLDGLHA